MNDRTTTREGQPAHHRSGTAFASIGALALLLAAGCEDDFEPGSLLLEARVIGAVTEVEGARERAVPAPGERFTVRWVVGQPEGDAESFTWSLAACAARPSPVGRPFCIDAPFFVAGESVPTTSAPEAAIEVPEALGQDTEVLLLGVFCREGTPDVATFANPQQLNAFTVCTEGVGQILAQSLRVGTAASNLRPRWPEQPVRLNGESWPDEGECLPVEQDGVELSFAGLETVVRDEVVVQTDDVPPETLTIREALLISHHTTTGELERQFGILDDDEAPRAFDWTPEGLRARTRVRFARARGCASTSASATSAAEQTSSSARSAWILSWRTEAGLARHFFGSQMPHGTHSDHPSLYAHPESGSKARYRDRVPTGGAPLS